MVSIEKAVVARISKAGNNFEILVDPDKALEFRKGVDVSIENALAVREVFKDSKKGERASGSDMEKYFGTRDVFEVAKQIIKKGEIQLTTEHRRKMVEEKRKQIANMISKQGINPQTRLPHPPQRILNAMDEAHVDIDPFKPATDQVKDALEKIREVIPISIEKIEIAIKVPMQHAGKASSLVRNIAPIKNEEWKSDAWYAVIEIPAGMQSDVYARLNELTAGTVETKIVKRKQV
jgi:ribosome maturation protein SDO1